MAFTQFTEDMDIIVKLPDNPNSDAGLTAAQFKAEFDKGGKAIKAWINDTHLPEVGDMNKSTYDTNADGKVDEAESADEATKLATARTITVGGKANTFDGSANISFTLADMGAAAAADIPTLPTQVGVTISNTDLTAGSSSLATNALYVYYV